MNSSTHALIGGLIGVEMFAATPIYFTIGFFGGLMPDLDSVLGIHRRTLHYPWIYSITGLFFLIIYFTTSNQRAGLTSLFLISAGFHSLIDLLAGGELRSWKRKERKDKAVYDHLRQKWFKPRRILYGPSVRDLSIAILASLFILIRTNSLLIVATVSISMITSTIYYISIKYMNLVPKEFSTFNEFLWAKLRKKERKWP